MVGWAHHPGMDGLPIGAQNRLGSSPRDTRSVEPSGTLGRRESRASSGLVILVTHGLVVNPYHLKHTA
eukprot:345497-Prymnesium_polylepis.1